MHLPILPVPIIAFLVCPLVPAEPIHLVIRELALVVGSILERQPSLALLDAIHEITLL
jgi:hypothetical protein